VLRRRVGRPGLVGTMARTAVVAGTATAVSGRVQQRQQAKAEQQAEQQAAYQEQQAEQQPPAQQQPAQDPVARLRELAELKQQGVLTDEEFAAMKAKLIGA